MAAQSYVVKVEIEGALRRMTLDGKQGGRNGTGELAVSFAQLEGRVRDLFQLPAATPLVLTYVDRDGDVVTMGEDQDVQDALVLQSLNPLRLTATKVGEAGTQFESKNAAAAVAEKVAAALQSEVEAGVEAKEPAQEPNSSGGNGMEKMDVEEEENESKDKCKDVHYGIRCDGCNVFPIMGTRFKSCSKANYYLCRPCFERTGAGPNDYVTINRQFRRLVEPPFFVGRGMNRRNFGPRGGMGMRSGRHPGCGAAAAGAKTDAARTGVEHKGVQCDECGATPIQGPRFKSITRFDYDVCLACFEKGGSKAAEYTRYDQPAAVSAHPVIPMMGRMFGPIGPMFGYTAVPRCGRRLVVRGQNGDVYEKAQPETKATPSGKNETGKAGKGVNPASASAPAVDEEKVKGKGDAKSSEEKEMGSAAAEAAAPAAAAGENQSSLDALMAKLDAMGFTDNSLNRELLEKNDLDLRKTLDELVSAEKWDPILGDLKEMGFYDDEMNRRLLFKNNGSMKRVVRELVQMDKDQKQA